MGAARALTAARQIKTSWWGAERRSEGTNGSRGQRLGLPSSVIICMLVPLFFSWLSETSGSSLPGLANGDETVQGGGEMVWMVIETVLKSAKKAFCCPRPLSSSPELLWDIHGCPVSKRKTPWIRERSGYKARAVTALYRYNNNKLFHG